MADSVQALTDLGYTYEKDGALWLNTSRILAENLKKAGKSDADIEKLGLKDDVLRRANGFYTYFAADIAYHRNKFAVRGFDKVINVWGADHHGHVARLKGALDALGLDGTNRLDIVLMQLVKLLRDGEVVRMSKRTGKAISLSDLLDEVPVDAARWFFNAKPDTQMEFDLGLAVREDSENPIYYVEYAHARGISVEAEIGKIFDATCPVEVIATGYTDPDVARRFAKDTNIDCLAVSIGTAHGIYKYEPKINFDLLKELVNTVSCPIVVHGGSGTPDEDVIQMVELGIAKLNVGPSVAPVTLMSAGREAVKQCAMHKIDLLTTFRA